MLLDNPGCLAGDSWRRINDLHRRTDKFGQEGNDERVVCAGKNQGVRTVFEKGHDSSLENLPGLDSLKVT